MGKIKRAAAAVAAARRGNGETGTEGLAVWHQGLFAFSCKTVSLSIRCQPLSSSSAIPLYLKSRSKAFLHAVPKGGVQNRLAQRRNVGGGGGSPEGGPAAPAHNAPLLRRVPQPFTP
ncbi:MAG: hypothetical protein AB7E47_13385, partial [Desulfovibrionaceae bacterium]